MDNEKLANEKPVNEAPVVPKGAGRGPQKGSAFLSSVPTDEAPDLKAKTSMPIVTEAPQPMDLLDPGERDGIFRQLVTADSDIAGLVAYSIYKQNKLDWLTAFEQAKGRAPNADEQASYIIGESTSRRLVTYRHLAEAMLAGTGPSVGSGNIRPGSQPGGVAARGTLTPALVSAYALIAVLLIIGFFVAAHFTMTSR